MVRMPWRFKNMCSQSLILKEILNKTIREMEEISSLFVNDSSINFSRNRVFTFSETIIQPSPKTNETKSAWQMVERSHIYLRSEISTANRLLPPSSFET